MWDRRAEFISNYDGDTIKMILDQGFNDEKTVDVRLFGVYAPELRQDGGPETKAFVTGWFQQRMRSGVRWSFVMTTARMKVADREQKTLDRYVGTVTNLDGTENLNLAVMEFVRMNGYGGGIGS